MIKDVYTKTFFAHLPERNDYNPKLYVPSNWEPPHQMIPQLLTTRMQHFFTHMKSNFHKRRVSPNLLTFQRKILNDLRDSKELMIVMTDKNLGPAVIEWDTYVRQVLDDHLLKADTYRQIAPTEAAHLLTQIKMKVGQFLQSFSKVLPENESEYLWRSIKQHVKTPKFYLTMKIHKTPMATRPIVAIKGSFTSGLGTWLDQQLQPIVHKLHTYLKSSFELTELLKKLPDLPEGPRLFTADAISMYTNIDTDHALAVIRRFLPNNWLNKAIMEALDIIMRHIFFEFGDTSWLQPHWHRHGTPSAPSYATLYFGIHEKDTILRQFGRFFLFYKRYIDDVLGIWHCASANLDRRMLWRNFQADLDKFGKLRWEVSARATTAIFLDLQLTLNNGCVTYTLYETPLNLHMYLPPHSAHPPGVLRGLVFGMINRLYRLNSDRNVIDSQINTFFNRLIVRGYLESFLRTTCNARKPLNPPRNPTMNDSSSTLSSTRSTRRPKKPNSFLIPCYSTRTTMAPAYLWLKTTDTHPSNSTV
jgi:hypothetical protein